MASTPWVRRDQAIVFRTVHVPCSHGSLRAPWGHGRVLLYTASDLKQRRGMSGLSGGLRWPAGFVCPACAHAESWRTKQGL